MNPGLNKTSKKITILKYKWVALSGVILAIALFYSGYLLGMSLGERPIAQDPDAQATSIESQILDADFSLFWEAIKLTKEKYVGIDEVEDQDFLYGAVKGALRELDDPYTAFFEPEDAKKFQEDVQGSFGGIGAEIGIRKGQLLVIAPLKGNPAEKAGLKSGDKILKVDDTFTANMTIDKAVKVIRGETGTEVKLLILRNGWDEAKEFAIVRGTIIVPTLDWEMLAPRPGEQKSIAFFQLYNFNANASSLFRSSVLDALFKGTKGVILDLRNNSGGYLNVATDLAGWFLKKGDVVVKQRFRSGDTEALVARGPGALSNLPTVVLVNGGSASASEILAGALRDINGSQLVGETTFGKGSVQELETLKDNSTLKISTSEWLTPNDHSINKTGLDPDVEVTPVSSDTEEGEEVKDIQLEKAIEVLKPLLPEGRAIPTILLGL